MSTDVQEVFTTVERAEESPEINLGDLLDAISEFLARYVVFPFPEQPLVIALWVIHTWLIDEFEFTPYLHIQSPEKRCGKSLLMELLALFVRNPWQSISPTEAVLFRKIELDQPTALLDEIDAGFGAGRNEVSEPVRALLNAGYQRGTTVPRCVAVGRDFVIKQFRVFCPKCFAGIGAVPTTVADRSLVIKLVRRSRDEMMQRFRRREAVPAAAEIQAEIERYATHELTRDRIRSARPELPEELSDRQQDICEPLLAIADEAGGDWPRRSRTALVALCAGEGNEDDSLGVKLLQGIRDAFDEDDTDRFSTKSLLEKLVAQETDAPWAGWWESDLEHGNTRGPASKLARLLKPYGVRVRSIRLPDGSTPKGYHRDDFLPVWKRYCPLPPQKDATTPQEI
jgi:hypothetical protein